MSAKSKRKRDANASTEPGGDASLDQIRELLFGAQSRNTEAQLGELHEHLSETVRVIKDQLSRQIKDVEARLKQKLTALEENIRTERTERAAALKAITNDLHVSSAALMENISELDDRLESTDHELRRLLISELTSAADQWTSRQEELTTYVDEEFEDLRTNTAERAELSDLFRELGQRINGELKKPAPKV